MRKVTDPSLLAELNAPAPSAPAAKPVSDPSLLAVLNAPAPKAKPVSDPKLLEELNKPVQEKETALAQEEREFAEAFPTVSKAVTFGRELVSGETVAQLPEMLGLKGGAQASRELQTTIRQPLVPGYREVKGGAASQALQAAANIAAGGVGLVGTWVSLPAELAVVGWRGLGATLGAGAADLAGAAYRAGLEGPAVAMFGELGARSLANQQRKGNYVTKQAIADRAESGKEWVEGAAFAFSPAAFVGVKAALEGKEDPVNEAWETMKAYPVESLLPAWHGAKKAGTVRGKPLMETAKGTVAEAAKAAGRELVPEQVQTTTGDPVVLNKFGEALYSPTTAAQKLVERLTKPSPEQTVQNVERRVPGLKERIGDTIGDALAWTRETVEPKWQKMAFDVVSPEQVAVQKGIAATKQATAEVRSPAVDNLAQAVQQYGILRDIETELSDPAFKAATDLEKFQAIEGTLPGVEMFKEVPVLDKENRVIAQSLGEALVANGMDVDTAQKAIPFLVLETMRNNRSGQFTDPMGALTKVLGDIKSATPEQAKVLTDGLGAFVKARMNDPNFLAAADTQWTGQGYRWVPGKDLRQRDKYMQAFESLRKADKEMGRTTFDISVPELGELRKEYVFSMFANIVDDLRSSPEGAQRVLQVLRESPISRFAANPTAPTHIQALAAWANKPGGKRAQLMDLLNKSALEAADNMGFDPLVIAKRHDRYLSRAFTDAIGSDVRLVQFLKQMESEMPTLSTKLAKFQTPRFARKLDLETSNKRFVDMVNRGDISLGDALRMTVVSSMTVTKHLANMNELYNRFNELGLVSDTEVKGAKQISPERVARKGKAASDDPYNFVYGKLAGKWVQPELAHQLGLVKSAMERWGETYPTLHAVNEFANEVLKFNRFTHTMLNQPQHLQRNAVSDPLLPMVASGLNPYTGEGKKILLEVQAASDRFERTVNSPEGAVMSPELAEMNQQGLNLRVALAMENLPQGAADAINRQADFIVNATRQATDPMDRVGAFARAATYTRAYGSTITKGVSSIWWAYKDTVAAYKGDKPVLEAQHRVELAQAKLQSAERKLQIARNGKDKDAIAGADLAYKDAVAEMQKSKRFLDSKMQQYRTALRRPMDPNLSTAHKALMWPSQFLSNYNAYLSDSAIVLACAKMERERAMWAFTVARRKLGLDPARAAIFVKEHVYGHERAPEAVRFISNNPMALIGVPLFVNYGLWQTSKFTRKALNDPKLWQAYVISQGLKAVNEHDMLQEPEGDKALTARLNKVFLQRTAFADLGLGTVKGVEDALSELGLSRELVKSVMGRPESALAFNLSDPIGGQTFLHQINADRSGGDLFFQFGVYGPAFSQQLDENMRNFNDPGSMPMPGDKSAPSWAKATWRSLVLASFPSTMHVKNVGFTREMPVVAPFGRAITGVTQQVRAKMEGNKVLRNMYGGQISPMEVAGKEVGWIVPNIMDSVAYVGSLSRRMEYEANVMSASERKYNASLPPNMSAAMRNSSIAENHINTVINTAIMRLNYGWPMGLISRERAVLEIKRLEKIKRDAINKLNKGEPNGDTLVQAYADPYINGYYGKMAQIERDALEDIEGDDEDDEGTQAVPQPQGE